MAQRPRYADFARSQRGKNYAGPDWCITETGSYFRDGKMNRDPKGGDAPGDGERPNSLGRTVRVEHYHYKDRGE
jgi:hypothetical protein